MNHNQTAVLYCRYSSHNQRDVSIDQQIKACEAYAEREGIAVVKVYADRAMTGTNDRRPQFQRMISEAPALGIQYIIVYSLDRFARDRYDSAVYKRQLKQQGIRVLSATENISDDPSGVLLESMLEGLAEYYSVELSRKIRRGLDDNAAQGLVNGPQPYGYRSKNGKIEIDSDQAAVVKEVYRRTLAGETRADIVADLNARRIPTRLGKTWKRTSLEPMLKNERYAGVYIYGSTRVEGAMPQIIDRDTFDAVQAILAKQANPNAPKRRKTDGGVYLLTGRVFCGHCGSPMVGLSGKSRDGTLHHYYVCKGHRYARTCDKKAIRRDTLERDVAMAIRQNILTNEMIEAIADLAIEQQKQAAKSPVLAALKKERADTQKAIDNIMCAIEQGIITPTTRARLEEHEANAQRLDAEIAAERYAHRINDTTRDELIATLRLFQRGDIEDEDYRATLIDTFVRAVYVFDDKYKIIFHLGNGKEETVTLPAETDDPTAEPEDPKSTAGSPISNVRTTETTLHHTGLIQTEAQIIAVGTYTFLLICQRA